MMSGRQGLVKGTSCAAGSTSIDSICASSVYLVQEGLARWILALVGSISISCLSNNWASGR